MPFFLHANMCSLCHVFCIFNIAKQKIVIHTFSDAPDLLSTYFLTQMKALIIKVAIEIDDIIIQKLQS